MKILIILIVFILTQLTGCTGREIDLANYDTPEVQILVGALAREIACEVKKTGDIDLATGIENIYLSVKAGELTDGAVDRIAEYTADRPTLAPLIADLIELLGVRIENVEGMPELRQVSPAMLKKIERGWLQGMKICAAPD